MKLIRNRLINSVNIILILKKDEHPDVAESAVVAYPHDIFGEGIQAYVVLKENVQHDEKDFTNKLKNLVKSKIAHYAMPHRIIVTFLYSI